MSRLTWSLVLSLWFFNYGNAQAATLAFPGAEGFGRFTIGGRGGKVIEVTNLQNSGTGSLRAALEASGPRTVIFRVSGTINLTDHIRVAAPFLTIAGQTAPGDGVQIKGGGIYIETNDVIVRYLRIRPGANVPNPGTANAFRFLPGANNNIIDHCSLSWGTDQIAAMWGAGNHDNTIQWSILSEGLNCSTHPSGCFSKGLLQGGGSTKLTLHHNLFAHNKDRNPNLKSGELDIVNNIFYNYPTLGTNIRPEDGVMRVNMVGNHYLRGPGVKYNPIRLYGGESNALSSGLYLKGNIDPVARPNNSLPESDVTFKTQSAPWVPIVTTRFDFPLVTTTDAFQAKIDVLAGAGATLPIRDPVDIRVVKNVLNNSGGLIDDPSQVGGWPNLASGTPQPDSDRDGMPDSWEIAYGLTPNNASDGSQDADNDGYTNLEEYLNNTEPTAGIAAFNPPTNLRVVGD